MASPPIGERLRQAAALYQSGDASGALREADEALLLAPNDAEALHMRALALSRLGNAAAVDAFEAAAAAHSRKDVILVNLGNFLKSTGRIEEARTAYERAAAFDPRSANALNALGLACSQLGDRTGARKALLSALAADPKHAGALNNLGNIEAAGNRIEAAVGYFTRALEVSPNLFSARINRGAALRTLGHYDEALADQMRAASIAPGSAEAYYQQAATFRTLGRFEEAAEAYRTAISLDKTRADIHRDYANMAFEIGKDPFDIIDKTIDETQSPVLMTARGESSLLMGDADAALHFGKRAILFARNDARAHGLLARASHALRDENAALQHARRAIELSPDDFELLHACCEIEMANGEFAVAADRLRRDAPIRRLQKHLALKAIALRAAGDEAYRQIYDYDRLTAQIAIDPPPGYSTISAFNDALAAAISGLHKTTNRPVDQTLYGGTQSVGRFWNEPDPVIQAYVAAMRAAAREFVDRLPDDPAHPFLSRKSRDLTCVGAWSVKLASGGGHVDHIHPAGWVSACYYVAAPPEIFDGDRAGFLRLGASGIQGLDLAAERYFPPTAGAVVFFPSYMWHGVEPFVGSGPRITAPFDLAPADETDAFG